MNALLVERARKLLQKAEQLDALLETMLELDAKAAQLKAKEGRDEFVKAQEKLKAKSNTTHREDVGAEKAKAVTRLCELKLAAAKREMQRLLKLQKVSLSDLDEAKTEQVEVELESVASILADGIPVLEKELAARKSLLAAKALKKHQNAFPGFYQQANEIADVPLAQVNRSLTLVERLTIAATVDDASKLLGTALKDTGLSVTKTKAGPKDVIRVGGALDLDLDALGEEGTKKILSLLRNMAGTKAGLALLKGIEQAGKTVTIKNNPNPDNPYFSQGLASTDKTSESSSDVKHRHKRHKEMTEEQSDLESEPWFTARQRLHTELVTLRDEYTQLVGTDGKNATTTTDKKNEFNLKAQEISTFEKNNAGSADGWTRYLSLNKMKDVLKYKGKYTLQKASSNVEFATEGKGTELLKAFKYAGVTDRLPEDLVLFHEMTHSLNTARAEGRSHLGSDRYLNEEEEQTVKAETEYAEQIGYKWKRLAYDSSMSPIDSRDDVDLPKEREEALRKGYDRSRLN